MEYSSWAFPVVSPVACPTGVPVAAPRSLMILTNQLFPAAVPGRVSAPATVAPAWVAPASLAAASGPAPLKASAGPASPRVAALEPQPIENSAQNTRTGCAENALIRASFGPRPRSCPALPSLRGVRAARTTSQHQGPCRLLLGPAATTAAAATGALTP